MDDRYEKETDLNRKGSRGHELSEQDLADYNKLMYGFDENSLNVEPGDGLKSPDLGYDLNLEGVAQKTSNGSEQNIVADRVVDISRSRDVSGDIDNISEHVADNLTRDGGSDQPINSQEINNMAFNNYVAENVGDNNNGESEKILNAEKATLASVVFEEFSKNDFSRLDKMDSQTAQLLVNNFRIIIDKYGSAKNVPNEELLYAANILQQAVYNGDNSEQNDKVDNAENIEEAKEIIDKKVEDDESNSEQEESNSENLNEEDKDVDSENTEDQNLDGQDKEKEGRVDKAREGVYELLGVDKEIMEPSSTNNLQNRSQAIENSRNVNI